ncbi:MAG TPA: amino acid adenylation domain-containing protein [Blastocatellia bacterium]|nr:amino acid adenylation domain-containing protein [Blastocatellia bacterium]
MSQPVTDLTNLSLKQRAILELKLRERRRHSSRAVISRQAREGDCFPLSYAQQRLWFIHQLAPESPAYNVFAALRLKGKLDAAALERALSEVVRRHESLRTTFPLRDEQPVQLIAPAAPVDLKPLDLSTLAEERREEVVRHMVTEEAHRPFNLAEGPLFRTGLLMLGEQEHILLLSMHHIISDGWSMGVLLREIATAYNAYSRGAEPVLPELTVQYVDHAVWQRQYLESGRLEAQLEYWKQQLAGAPLVMDLATDRARPAVQSLRGSGQGFALSKGLSEALSALSLQAGVTLFMTLLAAFKVLLYRYTGQPDLLVGTPVAGRNRVELEGLIGFFVNMLVLRTDLSDDPHFIDLLQRVREAMTGAQANQDLPFDRLVEQLQPARDPSYTPLFQVAFTLHKAQATVEFSGLTAQPVKIENRTAKYDLALFMTETKEGLRGSLVYSTDLFDAASISRMIANFQVLLEAIATDPYQRISSLPFLTEGERRQLLLEWNSTRAEYPRQVNIHQQFEQQSARTPEAVAIAFAGEQITYRELNQRANQLAHHLLGMGVGREALVGICMERSIEMVVALLGVLKAGAAYVPLDPTYPLTRLSFMLEDSQAPVLLVQQRLLDRLGRAHRAMAESRNRRLPIPDSRCKVLCLDTDWARLEDESREDPAVQIDGDLPAYLIYTSGSTGQPKGAVISHRAITNHMLWFIDRFSLKESDSVLQKTPFSFDASVWEFYAPLMTGGRLVVARPGGHQDSAYLVRTIIEQEVTILQLVPSLLQMLLEEPDLARCSSLRHVFCGGEALMGELQDRFGRVLGAQLHNLYGPTEASIDVTHWACGRESERPTAPIGRPISNTQIYLLSRDLRPVPIGVPGELYVGGDGLARGYLNRADLTAEKFIPDPFADEAGARIYKTGDLARYLPDGNLEFLGRLDHQVKIRGFRIELGEIESALRGHEAVRDAAVVARDDSPGEKRLVAYVVAEPGENLTADQLHSHLQQVLPDYMVPPTFVLLAELPLTPNGKVDRRALPPPEEARKEMGPDFRAPRNLLELRLAQIWEDLLQVRPIGITDNFFELGGHSLLAKRLMIRIEKQLGQSLPLTLFFQEPTIAALARELGAQGAGHTASSLVAIQPRGNRRPFFCVHSVGGDVMRFYSLAQELGDDQPFYGFQAKHPSELGDEYMSVEEFASRYIAELRTVQERGPYLIGGYSYGSVIAFEMAQQLKRQAEEVALLALLDGGSPLILKAARARRDAVMLAGFARDLARASGVEMDLPHEKVRQMEDEEGINYILGELKRHKLVAEGTEAEYFWRFMKGLRLRARAVSEYEPGVYHGVITLFRSSEIEPESAAAWREAGVDVTDRARGWDRLTDQPLVVHYVPGHHSLMVNKPHVTVLARKLRACLDQAQERLAHSQSS